MNADSELQRIAVQEYKKLFGHDPKVLGIHAGLECGLFSEKYPGIDMISFGPTLRFVPTVQMVWDHMLAILREID